MTAPLDVIEQGFEIAPVIMYGSVIIASRHHPARRQIGELHGMALPISGIEAMGKVFPEHESRHGLHMGYLRLQGHVVPPCRHHSETCQQDKESQKKSVHCSGIIEVLL